jgi:hypothetical protein
MTQDTYHINKSFVCFSSYLVATVYLIFNETRSKNLRYEEVI